MSLEIEISGDNICKRIRVAGSLDTNTAPELQGKIDSDVGAEISMLILDFKKLEFLSSAGLQVVFKTKRMVESYNGKFMLVNLQPQIRKVFEIVKALDGMDVFRNDDEMDDYLAAMQNRVLDGD